MPGLALHLCGCNQVWAQAPGKAGGWPVRGKLGYLHHIPAASKSAPLPHQAHNAFNLVLGASAQACACTCTAASTQREGPLHIDRTERDCATLLPERNGNVEQFFSLFRQCGTVFLCAGNVEQFLSLSAMWSSLPLSMWAMWNSLSMWAMWSSRPLCAGNVEQMDGELVQWAT